MLRAISQAARTKARARLAVLLAVVLMAVAAIIASGGSQHRAPVMRAGQRGYVDCSRPLDGDGSIARPWNRLTDANRALLGPGTSLLLRRGTICHGSLAPSGSGSATAPIVIGAYGSGQLPRIVTAGSAPDALRLADEAHVVLQDLDLTNHGNYEHPLRGIHVVASQPGTVHDITIRRVYVHDVEGADNKGLGGSGGIQVDLPTANVVIEDSLVEDVNRSGIWLTGTGRPPRPSADQAWPSATTGIIIRRNTLRRVGGDGIVPLGTLGADVADNVVCCANLRGRPGRQYDAGIWTFYANRTVIERNYVYAMANGKADGTGYDIDYEQDGTVVQANAGYGNAGGFMLLCATAKGPRTARVRFNLSVQEYIFSESICEPHGSRASTLSGIQVYNNTFLTPSSRIWHDNFIALPTLPNAGTFEFFNNIVAASTVQPTPFPCGSLCFDNLFWGVPPSGRRSLSADPRFLKGNRPGNGRIGLGAPFRLRSDSPAAHAGIRIPSGPGSDYFGDPIPAQPSIGFYQPRR